MTSSVAKKQGKYPSWDDSLSFQLHSDNIFKVVVWDKDTLSKDDFVAEGSLCIDSTKSGKDSQNVSLTYKGKPAGQIFFDIEFTPKP
jgi:Ca2+-dependent lipid-binding protein